MAEHCTCTVFLHIVSAETRGWSPKFATGLNIIIDICSSKSIRVTNLSFCQNDPPKSTLFWQKNSLVTHIFFDLCLLSHSAQSQILVTKLFFGSGKCGNFHIVSTLWHFFYFTNWIVAAENIEERKVFKGGNYLRKYGNRFCTKELRHFLKCNFLLNKLF